MSDWSQFDNLSPGTSIRRYYNNRAESINSVVHHLEFFQVSKNRWIQRGVSASGDFTEYVPWSLRDADNLVDSGHWRMVEDVVSGRSDVPDASRNVEVW